MHAVWQVARGWAAPCPPPRRLLQTKGECAEGAQGCVQNVHSSFVLASLLVCVLSRIFTACESVCLAARVCPGCSQLSYARLPQRLCAPRVFTARVCPGCWQPVCPPGSQLKCVEMVHSSCAYQPRSSRAPSPRGYITKGCACVRAQGAPEPHGCNTKGVCLCACSRRAGTTCPSCKAGRGCFDWTQLSTWKRGFARRKAQRGRGTTRDSFCWGMHVHCVAHQHHCLRACKLCAGVHVAQGAMCACVWLAGRNRWPWPERSRKAWLLETWTPT